MHFLKVIFFGAVSLGSVSSHAVLFAHDSFTYTPSQFLNAQSGGIGFANAWSSPAPYLIASSGLPSPGASGRAVSQTSQTRGTSQVTIASRNLSQTFGVSGTRLYGSFTFRQDVVGAPATSVDHDFGGFFLGNPSGARAYLGIGGNTTNSGQIVAGTFGNNLAENSTGITVVQGLAYQVVFRIDFMAGNDQIRLYVNPMSPVEPMVGVLKNDLDLGSFFTIGFTANQKFTFDEVRLANTYGEASAVPEPLSASVLGIGFAALLRRRSAVSKRKFRTRLASGNQDS